MKVASILFLICACLLEPGSSVLAQTATPHGTPVLHTDQDLLAQIQNNDNSVARQAIKIASETKRLNVLMGGMSSPDYDIRIESLKALHGFKASQKKSAILAALRDEHLWKREPGGEQAAVQMVYLQQLRAVLSNFGIDAQSEELLVTTTRRALAEKLAATITAD